MNLKKDERIDDLEYSGLKIIQKENGFCFGIDSILISDFAKEIKSGSVGLDLGTGTGIISILLAAKTNLNKIIGIEVQKDIANMVTKETEYSVFELTEALSKKDANRAVELLSLMDKDTKTINLILNHFRRLFFVAISKDEDLPKLLNVKEYAIVKAKELSRNFSKIQLKNIYSLLDDVDFYIKNGQMQIENALYYLIFGILSC